MTLPFTTRNPSAVETEAIRLMLSSFRDGSGAERDPDGHTRPNWRQIERVFSELFTGEPPPESKSIFDLIAYSLDNPINAYGISVKSKQLSCKNFDDLESGSRVYMELANSPAKLFDVLNTDLGFTEANFRAYERPKEVGECVLRTINKWHYEGKKLFEDENPTKQLDLHSSIYLCVTYRKQKNKEARKYQIHSFPLQFEKVGRWAYSGRALRGYDANYPTQVIFDWYGLSGGQLKFYPRAVDALYSSPVFELETPKRLDIFDRVQSYWPQNFEKIRSGLHQEMIRRNLK